MAIGITIPTFNLEINSEISKRYKYINSPKIKNGEQYNNVCLLLNPEITNFDV